MFFCGHLPAAQPFRTNGVSGHMMDVSGGPRSPGRRSHSCPSVRVCCSSAALLLRGSGRHLEGRPRDGGRRQVQLRGWDCQRNHRFWGRFSRGWGSHQQRRIFRVSICVRLSQWKYVCTCLYTFYNIIEPTFARPLGHGRPINFLILFDVETQRQQSFFQSYAQSNACFYLRIFYPKPIHRDVSKIRRTPPPKEKKIPFTCK